MRARLGQALQLTGLVLLPAAVWYGIEKGDLYGEFLIAAVAVALLLMGGSLRGRRVP